MKTLTAASALACALLVAVAAAAAAPDRYAAPRAHASAAPIAYGVADDTSKYAEDGGASFYSLLTGAGMTENRWTLAWDASRPTEIAELPFLQRAAPRAKAAGVRIVLALYSKKASQHDPDQFCAWAGVVAATVAKWGIREFIVWNEPNTRLYWTPQKDAAGNDVAAAEYEELAAKCYDAIKAANPDAMVIGMGLSPRASTSESTEPLVFLRDVGRAYRASGRRLPIMDQLAIHPYPNPNQPADSPDVGYPSPDRFGIPNIDRVKQALQTAFAGTGQPTTSSAPGGLPLLTLRIDEVGWQVDTTGITGYVNDENVRTVSEQTQAAYLKRMISTYFACDPAVTDVLLFLLVDEKYRNGRDESGAFVGGGWQSGLVRLDGVKRPAYLAIAQAAAAGRTACTGAPSTKPSKPSKPTAKKPPKKKKP